MRRFPHLEEEFLSVFSSEISVSHTEPFWDTEKKEDLDDGHHSSVKEVFLHHAQHVLTKAGKGFAVDFGLTSFTGQPSCMLEVKAAIYEYEHCMSSKHRLSLALLFLVQSSTQSSTVRIAGAVVSA